MKQVLTGKGPYPVVSERYRKIRNALTVFKHLCLRSGYRKYLPEA